MKGGDSYNAVMSKPANKFSNGTFTVAFTVNTYCIHNFSTLFSHIFHSQNSGI